MNGDLQRNHGDMGDVDGLDGVLRGNFALELDAPVSLFGTSPESFSKGWGDAA